MQGWKGIKIWKVKPFLLWAEYTIEGVFGLWVGCWVEEASSRAWRKFTIFISNTCASRMYAIFSFMQKKIAVWLWKKKIGKLWLWALSDFPHHPFPHLLPHRVYLSPHIAATSPFSPPHPSTTQQASGMGEDGWGGIIYVKEAKWRETEGARLSGMKFNNWPTILFLKVVVLLSVSGRRSCYVRCLVIP